MIRKIKFALLIAICFTFALSTNIYANVENSDNVITGEYQFSSSLEEVQLQNKFKYRDACFTRSSYLGCKHLESLSIQVAASSISFYGQEPDFYELDTENNAHNVIDFLTKMEFEDVETNKYYKTEKHENSMGVCVGHKNIIQDGNSYTLLAIVPRSAGYKQEWSGNFTIGDGDIHEGFKAARDEILRFVKYYINENGIEGNIKVWISGYSRGAAISDMLGGFFAGGGIEYFDGVVSITPEDVYCYTIGTPRTIKDGLDKNIELSVSANRDEEQYKDDTDGEEFVYTNGGNVVVGDEIYSGLRNLISSTDSFPLLPPEEWGFTHYGNRIDPTEGLSSVKAALKELKSISEYVYDIYTENDKLKTFKLKTFDLKTLSIVSKRKTVNPTVFMKEKVDGLAERIGSNSAFKDEHYQDGLKAFIGAYGILAPILNDAIAEAEISTGDAVKTLLYTYMAYASEVLQEKGLVDNDKEAVTIVIKDLLEHFLEIDIDTETFTVDDLFANIVEFLADNIDEPVGEMAVSAIVDNFPEDYKPYIFSIFGQFHKDYYIDENQTETNPDLEAEDVIKEFIKACAYGADPECNLGVEAQDPRNVRNSLYMIIAMATYSTYPDITTLLFGDNSESSGPGLFTDAVDLLVSQLKIETDENGDVIKEYANISELADEKLLSLLDPVLTNGSEICEDIYGEELREALEYEIDEFEENITEARKAISTLMFYKAGDFDTVASIEGALSLVDDAMTVAMSHLDEIYLAYSRKSNRYEYHVLDDYYREVQFELNRGRFSEDHDNPVKVLENECIVEPKNPVRNGYKFVAWYTDKELNDKFDFSTPITDDIILYAKWRRKLSSNESVSSSKSKGETPKSQGVVDLGNSSEGTNSNTNAETQGVVDLSDDLEDANSNSNAETQGVVDLSDDLEDANSNQNVETQGVVDLSDDLEDANSNPNIETQGVVDLSDELEDANSNQNTETQEVISWSNASEWATQELIKANKKGLVPSTFKSKDFTKPITRSEFAAVAVKLYEKITGEIVEAASINPFADTNDEYVLKAYNLGIAVGISENEFGNSEITREQMAVMTTRALAKAGIDISVDLNKVEKLADDTEIHSWGKPAVYYMFSIGAIRGVGNNNFGAKGNASIEQALLISTRSVEKFGK